MDIRTRLAQAGMRKEERVGAISFPIYQTATFRHPALGHSTGYDYTRTSNPTRSALEEEMASLEGGSGGFAFASGMAAVTAVAMLLAPGDHLIVSDDLYGGTYRLFEALFRRYGIDATYVDTSDPSETERSWRSDTKAAFLETPSNPMMKVCDIEAISALAHGRGGICIVDNTFMTPYLQRPIEHGADIVIHSGTKYLGGHNDTVCGIVVTAGAELSERIGYIQNATGGVLAPFDSWLVLRGLKTLSVRLDRAEENARRIAAWLSSREDVRAVFYPGLDEAPGVEVHRRQASGFGAMISFRVRDADRARAVIDGVKTISFAESLGGVETLITYPARQTHADIPAELRERLGVDDTLLRLSVGIERVEDLIDDLEGALRS